MGIKCSILLKVFSFHCIFQLHFLMVGQTLTFETTLAFRDSRNEFFTHSDNVKFFLSFHFAQVCPPSEGQNDVFNFFSLDENTEME